MEANGSQVSATGRFTTKISVSARVCEVKHQVRGKAGLPS